MIETICVSVNLDFFIAASWRFYNARKLYFSSVSFQGKLTLPPGIYFFAAEIQDGKPTGKIIEEREDYQRKEEESSGVTFGFYPKGFIPEELKLRPIMEWLYEYPFIARVMDLHQAPESFLTALSHHLNSKMKPL